MVLLKAGYKTTEFLVTVAVLVATLAAACASALTPRYAAIASSISAGAYAVSRGLAKLGVLLHARTGTTVVK
jgi:hypothetical protein